MSESRILVVGESVIDIVETSDGSRTPHPGGSPANVAVGLGRLGLDVSLATQLGNDPYGDMMRKHFAESGVKLIGDPTTDAPTPTALVQLDPNGEASYTLDVTWDPKQPPIEGDYNLVHTGSIAALVAPGCDMVRSLLKHMSKHALVSYDPNIRPSLLRSRAEAVHDVERIVGLSDFVKVSRGDLEWLYPDRRPEAVAYDWLAAGAAIVVVTASSHGWRAYSHCGTIGQPHGARTVVDTIGAGDAFTAALIAGIERHGLMTVDSRKKLRKIDQFELEDIVALASRAATLTVGQSGAEPPRREQLWPVRG
jgi:fructokinase